MAPHLRRQMRKVIVEHESDDDVEESSEEEEEEEEGGGGGSWKGASALPGRNGKAGSSSIEEEGRRKRGPITISLKAAKCCKVCKGEDHQAGFVGAIYVDCPNKPCFLCKQPGHTTITCPHRAVVEHGISFAPRKHSLGVADFLLERQIRNHLPLVRPNPVIPNYVDCAIIRLHSRRVTYIEFHPTKENILVSGDKKGQIGIWDYEKVYEKTVYTTIHTCIVNTIRFHYTSYDTIYTASSDGTTKCTDLETGMPVNIIDLNPDGWHGPSCWRMLYGLDINCGRGAVLAGDNFGFLYQIDVRANKCTGNPLLIHKKGSKVTGLHCNPVDPDLFITCGNDHTAKIWDLRFLESKCHLAELAHPRVVNSAYFSPRTGNKILTTCQDNRIRVYDCLFSDLTEPSREIIHSHDFNRYLTCFRAEWDPKDPVENLAVIGRYISDEFSGVALHPIDFIDTSTGQLVAEVIDKNITTICPVNKLHPQQDVLATGSSRSLFIWRPKEDTEDESHEAELEKWKASIFNAGEPHDMKKGKSKRKDEEEEDDDDNYFCIQKKSSGASSHYSKFLTRLHNVKRK